MGINIVKGAVAADSPKVTVFLFDEKNCRAIRIR